MTTLLRKKMRGLSGFTLIELLVVIAIIGVLASIVLASLNSARVKSRDARRITDIKQLQLAMELYFDGQTSASYPPGVDAAALGLLAPLYIPVVPTDPVATASYEYQALANTNGTACAAAPCLYYHLGANMEQTAAQNPTAFNADADRCAAAGAGCTSALTGTTVDGDDSDSCTGGVGRYCYDVNP